MIRPPAQHDSKNIDGNSPDEAWRTLVAQLGLQPHPEGGYYRETFRSNQQVSCGTGQRSAATSIYYLLADGAWSAWHRIDADETWYFHAGGALALHVLSPDGALTTHLLGNPLEDADTVFQATVPAGCWFAGELADSNGFALVGCVVAPAFEFSGFELARASDMQAAIHRHGEWVRRLLKA